MKIRAGHQSSLPTHRSLRRFVYRCVLLLLALVVSGTTACHHTGPSDQRPNVVVILIDTLRVDQLGLAGHPERLAPFLSRLSMEGVFFPNAYSTSSCTAPAVASLFTGLYPNRHGVIDGFFAQKKLLKSIRRQGKSRVRLNRIPDGIDLLPERFRALGYRTFGIATNINLGPEIGFDRGFDHFLRRNDARAGWILDRLMEWENDLAGDDPYFLYLHFNDPHSPYVPRKLWHGGGATSREETIAAYRSEIGYLDAVLQTIHEQFDLDENCILAVLSDHGEEFWDRGKLGHGFSLHDELNRALCLFHSPGTGLKPGVVEHRMSLVDVLPTLLELAGAEEPAGLDGESRADMLLNRQAGGADDGTDLDRPIFAHRINYPPGRKELWSVILGEWKLIDRASEQTLYHMALDPGEKSDLLAGHPEAGSRLASELELFKNLSAVGASASDVELGLEDVEALIALGYVEE